MTADQIRQGVWTIAITFFAFLVLGYLLGTELGAAPSLKTLLIWAIAFMSLAFPAGYLAHEHEDLQRRRS